jgi:hypothetical protein
MKLRAWRKPGDAVLAACLSVVAALLVLHYSTAIHRLGLHDVLRRLFYLPVVVAAIAAGARGGLLCAGLAAAGYLPHLRQLALAGDRVLDSAIELVLLLAIGLLVGAFADRSRRARALAAERGRLAAIGEVGVAMMAQMEGPLSGIEGQAVALGALADRGRDPAVAFAAGVLGDQVNRARRLLEDVRGLGCAREQRLVTLDLASLTRHIVSEVAAGVSPSRIRLVSGDERVAVQARGRPLAYALRSLLHGLLEVLPAGGTLEVEVVGSGECSTVRVRAVADEGELPDLEAGLSSVFGAGAKEYRFGEALCLYFLIASGAAVVFRRLSAREGMIEIVFDREPPGQGGRARAHARTPSRPGQPPSAQRTGPAGLHGRPRRLRAAGREASP